MTSSRSLPGLDRSPKVNWVEKAGGLPDYIERMAKHIHYEGGKDIGSSIAIAVRQCQKLCAGSTDPVVKAKACKAVTEWEELKKKAKADK